MIARRAFVDEHGIAALTVEQCGRLDDVVRLPSRDDEAERTAERIGQHVDLGGQSTSETPAPDLCPPFPLAAYWWAGTMVLSIIRYWVVTIGSQSSEHALSSASG